MTPANQVVLLTTLELAVPLWIDRVRAWPESERTKAAEKCAEVIAAHGDDLQFGGKHCAEAFNKLALALALGSFAPGGIKFCGQHWESK